jgi:hypothetical protein
MPSFFGVFFGIVSAPVISSAVFSIPHLNQMVQTLGLDLHNEILAPLGGIPPASCTTTIAVGCSILAEFYGV